VEIENTEVIQIGSYAVSFRERERLRKNPLAELINSVLRAR
jgi:hypothetical protein